MQYKNLKKTTGCKGQPGTGIEVLAIDFNRVDGMPLTVYQKNFGIVQNYVPQPGDKVKFADPFVLKTVDNVVSKFAKLNIAFDSGDLEYETVGDKGYESLTNKMMGDITNAFDPAVLEWIQEVTDSCGSIVLIDIPELNCYGVFGSTYRPVSMKFKGAKGKKAGDKNATSLEISDESGLIMKLYPKGLGVSILPD
jgi:hypothetical protein